MAQDSDLRRTLAEQILDIFRKDARVKEAFLRGSLRSGAVDAYSDIDIGIDVSGYNNADYCKTIIATMGRSFDLHFYDWAGSLMPDSYVLTFYIKGLPIFWNVDFQCIATPHHGTLTRESIERDTVASGLKVWALDAKYLLRRTPGIDQQISEFGRRTLGLDAVGSMNSTEILAAVLDHLRERMRPCHGEFADACQVVYEQQLLRCSSR